MVSAVSASTPLPSPSDTRKSQYVAPPAFGPLQAGLPPALVANVALPFPWLDDAQTADGAGGKRPHADVNEKLAEKSTQDEILAHGHAAAVESRQMQDRVVTERAQADFGERRAAFQQAMREVQQERAGGEASGKTTGQPSGEGKPDSQPAPAGGGAEGDAGPSSEASTPVRADSAGKATQITPRGGEERPSGGVSANHGDVAERSAASAPAQDAGASTATAFANAGAGAGASAGGSSAQVGGGAAAKAESNNVSGIAAAGAADSKASGASGTANTGGSGASGRAESAPPAGVGAAARGGTAGSAERGGAKAGMTGETGSPAGETDGEISAQSVRIESLMRVLKAQIHRRDASAVMRLDPGDLGPLRVQLQWSDSRVAVVLEPAGDLAHELLTEQVDSLRDGLERAGLAVERIEVRRPAEAQTHTGAGDPRQNPAQERHAAGQDATPQQQRPRHARTDADGGGARHASAAEPRDVRRVAAGSSRLNLWA